MAGSISSGTAVSRSTTSGPRTGGRATCGAVSRSSRRWTTREPGRGSTPFSSGSSRTRKPGISSRTGSTRARGRVSPFDGALTPKSHFVRRREAELLVERAPFVGGVEDDALHTVVSTPRQELPHERLGHAAPPPGPLGEDVQDERLRPTHEPRSLGMRTRQELPQLEARATDDLPGGGGGGAIAILREPRHVASLRDRAREIGGRRLDERVAQFVR